MSIDLKGTGVALVTPFTKNNEVDYAALEKLVNHVIAGGVNYLVVMGTTGESVTLSKDEKKKVVAKVLAVNNSRLPVVLGLGGNNTAELLEELQTTDFSGISALLSVSPAYNRPSQEGIYQHYAALAKKSPLPIILYNVPARTGSCMDVETTLRLAKEFKNIIAMKDASAHVNQCMDMIYGAPEGFIVTSGDDGLALPMMAFGAHGLISVIANAYPKETVAIVNAALKGDFVAARKAHFALTPVMKVIFEDGNPAGVKYFLHKLGIIENVLRLPLVPVKKDTAAKIDRIF
ncbi:MAG: 4-hydroxy-tetrahydrodipicolinate synthase [Flavobacteriales bacterium]